jgi:hypothetical protein
MLGGEAGNYTTTDTCKEKVPTIELATIKQKLLGGTLDYHKKHIIIIIILKNFSY